MRRQVEFYSSMQDAEKVQLCSRTIRQSIYRSAFSISVRQRQRQRASIVSQPTLVKYEPLVVQQMMLVTLPEQSMGLSTDFPHLQLDAAC
ncbi:hypothetical protein AVEN_264320-1 [Araneus ventricosus]|uniref:Uncharacterized protein n=1 Tax=Araneus ventricosus TaxID=182803 RepID=A0A4Y2PG45_ARAVE|nr:hypothetical protein AVEN_264320-1 [Araneus ventricosus]